MKEPYNLFDYRQQIFEELFTKNKSVSIHQINMQVLAAEFYKVHHESVPDIVNLFKIRNVIESFRNDSLSVTRNFKSVRYGWEAISSIGSKINIGSFA